MAKANSDTFDALKRSLKNDSGQININRQTLNGYWADWLSRYCFSQGECIEIDQVSVDIDEQKQQIQINGQSGYLQMPNLQTSARFWLDQDNQPQFEIHYALFDDHHTLQKWRFSDSFEGLPLKVSRQRVGLNDYAVSPFLDHLDFAQAAFVLSSSDQLTSRFDCPLSSGINFVGQLRPLGFLGVLQQMLPLDIKPVPIYGYINILANDTELELSGLNTNVSQIRLYPWEVEDYPVLGIHLMAKLPLAFSLGKGQVEDTYVRFYSPTHEHLSGPAHCFEALTAITARVTVPSAELAIDLVCDLNNDNPQLNFEGRFEGFSLANLSKLADICGPGGLEAGLPDVFLQALKPLQSLQLSSLGFSLSWFNNALCFEQISLGIEMADLSWDIWPKHIRVSDIGCQFLLHQPFSKSREIEIRLWGKSIIEGADVDIQAVKRSGQFQFMTVISNTALPLKKLMKSFAPGLPAPANLSVSKLKLVASPGHFCQFIGSLAETPDSWTLNLGPTSLTISNVQFDLLIEKQDDGYQSSGSFHGELNIGSNISIETSYTLPGEFMIRGSAQQLQFAELLSKLTGKSIKLPSGLDFTLTDASVMIKKGRSGLVLQLASNIEGFGYMAFEVKKVGGKWGAAAGISLDAGLGIGDVPGLSALKPIDKIALMQDFTLVISSYDGPQFRFPDMAAFANPALPAANVQLPATAGGVIEGFNSYGKWQLDSSGKQGKLLRTLLGLDPTVAITLTISNPPQKQSSLFTTIDTKLNRNWPLKGQLGIAFNQGAPEFFAAATLEGKIAGRKCRFDLALSFVTSGAYFTGSMLGSVKVGGVQLSNMVLMTSINYGGVPSLGIAATIDVGDISSSIALFFDSNNPAKSVFAGAISDISLADIASLFAKIKRLPDGFADVLENITISGTGEFYLPKTLATALDNLESETIIAAFNEHGGIKLLGAGYDLLLVVKTVGQRWALTDLADMMKHYSLTLTDQGIRVTLDAQIYNVPQATQIGSLTFDQGMLLNGKLSILDQSATCRIEISQNKGLLVAAQLEKPLIIYKKAFFRLAALDNSNTEKEGKNKGEAKTAGKGVMVSIATMRQPKHPEVAFRNPHIYLNGQLDMMGLTGVCYVSITSHGCFFKLSITQRQNLKLPGISGKANQATAIDGNFGQLNNLSASVESGSDYDLRLDFGELGKLRFKTAVAGGVAIAFDGRRATAAFSGSFSFKKQRYQIKLKLKVDGDDLAKLAELVAKAVRDCFADVFDDAGRWAKMAKDGLMEGVKGVDDASRLLKSHFKQDAAAAAGILRSAGHSMDTIGNSLKSVFNVDSNGMKKALKAAGYASSSIDRYVGSTFKSTSKAVSKTAKSTSKKAKSTGKKAKKKGKKAKKKLKKKF